MEQKKGEKNCETSGEAVICNKAKTKKRNI